MSEAGGISGSGIVETWFRTIGSTIGSIVCTGFGAYSMYGWTVAAIQRGRAVWFYAIALLAAILFAWSIVELVALRHKPKFAIDKRRRRRYGIGFNAIVVVEVAAIILGGPLLAHFHRQDLYPQWVALVVGVHFLPIAKLFQMPLYYVTGLAISLFALGSLLFPSGSIRLAVNSGGTGLVLWTNAVIILTSNLACIPAKKAFGAGGSA